jgi:hypothetical protein
MRNWKVAAAALVVLALVACSGSSPPGDAASKGARYVEIFKTVDAAYEEALQAAGRAHAAGLITDAQLERVRVAGTACEAALRASQAALEAYLAHGDPQGEVAVVDALAGLQQAVASLLAARSSP